MGWRDVVVDNTTEIGMSIALFYCIDCWGSVRLHGICPIKQTKTRISEMYLAPTEGHAE